MRRRARSGKRYKDNDGKQITRRKATRIIRMNTLMTTRRSGWRIQRVG